MLLDEYSQKSLLNAAIISDEDDHLRTLFNREFIEIERIAYRIGTETHSNPCQWLNLLFTDPRSSMTLFSMLSIRMLSTLWHH